MSSFVGHSLAAVTIFSCHKSAQSQWQRFLWLAWLLILALFPDLDHFIPALHQSNHHHVRISHSLTFALFLPVLTSLVLFLFGDRGKAWRIRTLQAIAVGFSHPLLDLLVGVVGIHLFWPFSWQLFALPFGILPSAGSLDLTNYYLYKNLLIEMGVLLPLSYSIYLFCHHGWSPGSLQRRISLLFLVSASFMVWASLLER